jgi:hypothetical protein
VLLSDLCLYDTTNRPKTQFDTGAEAHIIGTQIYSGAPSQLCRKGGYI